MNGLYLLTGSNLGESKILLSAARDAISNEIGVVTNISGLYKSASWGIEDQPDFLNQVLMVKTELSAKEVLEKALAIEAMLGRQRKGKWGSRLIDIDILYYGDEIMVLPDLKIPHPMMHERRFTLLPLAEVAPDMVHPVFQKTTLQLLADCKDSLPVERIDSGSD